MSKLEIVMVKFTNEFMIHRYKLVLLICYMELGPLISCYQEMFNTTIWVFKKLTNLVRV